MKLTKIITEKHLVSRILCSSNSNSPHALVKSDLIDDTQLKALRDLYDDFSVTQVFATVNTHYTQRLYAGKVSRFNTHCRLS